MEIKIENYNKTIKDNLILDDINLTLSSGHIYGLHGRNGSGKTMLLRAIAGLILPTSGCVTIDGKTVGKDIDFPDDAGILIENMTLIPENSGFTNLKLLAKINNKITDEDIEDSMSALGLDPYNKKRVKTYSLGMKQKLNIAQAVMEKPKLMLLDEPTNALDDVTIRAFQTFLLRARDDGALIILASHNKDDLELLCDSIIEIAAGKIIN